MKTIIAYINLEDTQLLNKINGFKNISQYIEHKNVKPEEWGKIVFEDTEIKFYASSKVEYSYLSSLPEYTT